MNEWIVTRINSLKEDLSKKQEYFKNNLTDLQALQIARNELSVAEIADLLLQNDGFKEVI